MFAFGSRHSLVIRWLGTKVVGTAIDRGAAAKAYLTFNTIDGKRDMLRLDCT